MKLAPAAAALSLLLVPLLGACDRSSTDLDDHNEFARVEVIDRSQPSQPVVAVWVSGAGWTGALPELSLAGAQPQLSLGVRVFDDEGDPLTLAKGAEFEIRYALASGAPAGILDLTRSPALLFLGDAVALYPRAAGTTRIQLILWHLNHADDATDPIPLTVRN